MLWLLFSPFRSLLQSAWIQTVTLKKVITQNFEAVEEKVVSDKLGPSSFFFFKNYEDKRKLLSWFKCLAHISHQLNNIKSYNYEE